MQMSHNLQNYTPIIGTFRAFPTFGFYKFYCSSYLLILIFICIFAHLLGWDPRSRITGSKGLSIFGSLVIYLQTASQKVSYSCPGLYKNLRGIFQGDNICFKPSLYFFTPLLSFSSIGVFSISQGLGPRYLLHIMSLIKMPVASVPSG